jgi:CBS domain containing-hemolysin-like protein
VQDEHDGNEEVPFRQVAENQYLVHGRMDLDDINRKLGTQIYSGEADTLAGFIYVQLGRVPDLGEQLEIDGLLLEVRNVVERQIRQVRVTRLPVSPSPSSPHSEGATV